MPSDIWLQLVKIRTKNHKLPAEIYSWKIAFKPRDKRLCTICDMGEVGDEYHFVMFFKRTEINFYQISKRQISQCVYEITKKWWHKDSQGTGQVFKSSFWNFWFNPNKNEQNPSFSYFPYLKHYRKFLLNFFWNI